MMLYSESVLDLYSENRRHGENMLYSESEIFAFSEDYKTWLCFESGGVSPESCFESGGVSPNFWSDEISSSIIAVKARRHHPVVISVVELSSGEL